MSEIQALPDMDQFQQHIREFVAYLLVNHRTELLSILSKNGVILRNPGSDKEVLTGVYIAIAKSKAFRNDLQAMMTDIAALELGKGPELKKRAIDDFVKTGAQMPTGFSSADGGAAEALPTFNSGSGVGGGGLNGIGSAISGASNPTYQNPTTGKGGFGNTAVGGFLSAIFTKENIGKAVGTGIDILGQKLTAKANQQQLDAATQLEVAKTQSLVQQQQTSATTANWLVPTLIISGLAIAGVFVALIIIKNHNK